MPAVLFGSIGTVAETSELQRAAFNEAFKEHGLDWNWSQDEYKELLEKSGGEDRIAEYASTRGEDVDAAAVYETKSDLFRRNLLDAAPGPREGVVDVINSARESGYKVGLITTTSRANVDALGAGDRADPRPHRVRPDRRQVRGRQPEARRRRLRPTRSSGSALRPEQCVAIENNLDGVSAAKAAGIACVAFPGEDNADHDFSAADDRFDSISFARLNELAGGEAAGR